MKPVPEERYAALDALRALAIFLVIFYHAVIPYAPTRLPNLEWAVYENRGPALYDWLMFAVLGTAMPLFFLLAGFNAAKLFDERGRAAFLKNRARRILLPFIWMGAAVLPLTYYIWGAGWWMQGRASWYEINQAQFDDPALQRNLAGPAHLWFLEYLLILYLLFIAVRWLQHKNRRHAPPQGDARALSPLWFVAPSAAILLVRPAAFYDFRNVAVPDVGRFFYNAIFFAAGTAVWSRRACFREWAGRGVYYLVPAGFAFAAMTVLLKSHLLSPLAGPPLFGLAVSIALFSWLAVFGCLGAALKFFGKPSEPLRFISDASYWAYFIHLPIVGFAQVCLLYARAPHFVKLSAVFMVGAAVSFTSYRWVSRVSWLSAVHGKKRRAPLRTESAGGVVLNAKNEVLVVSQHGVSWSLPKGHIDPGEDTLAAAKREIYEESGITQLELVKELGFYERHRIGKRADHEDRTELKKMHFFLFRTRQTELKPVDPHNPEARWVPKRRVAELLTHKKDKEFFQSIVHLIE